MKRQPVSPFFAWSLLALCLGPMVLPLAYAHFARPSFVRSSGIGPDTVFYATFVLALAAHLVAMWRVIRSRRRKDN